MRYLIIFIVMSVFGVAAAAPADWPEIRPGLWQMSMQMSGRTITNSSCLTEEMIRGMRNGQIGNGNPAKCDPPAFSRGVGGAYVTKLHCPDGDYEVRHIKVSDEKHHLETIQRRPGKPEMSMAQEMRYLGTCR